MEKDEAGINHLEMEADFCPQISQMPQIFIDILKDAWECKFKVKD
ncbi:hypothetical protein A33Q_3233 [Indibacter alkaliphilus LW1]|uniref:Uncharacterized protein n=1 Tax=Indibacter alkaliphilus (strain CCUG 57479 / KCTC 22604 / LW1) TaxID=1189612 RepID=S2DUT7_INDAL|nr:hypothetical protein A33Q_3233 [Indibacter alkaliphilus LW1]